MIRAIAVTMAALCGALLGCVSYPTNMPPPPGLARVNVSPEQAADIRQRLATYAPQDRRRMEIVLQRVETGQLITEFEARSIRGLADQARMQRDAAEEKQRREEQRLTDEAAAQTRKAVAAAEEQKRVEQGRAQMVADKKARYRKTYDAIDSVASARYFMDEYAGEDPDGLRRTAMAKGYTAGIASAQACIDRANRAIAYQNEIGAASGYVDKSVMYQAGAQVVQCRRQAQEYRSKLQQ